MVHRVIVEDQSIRWYGRPPKIADNSIEFVQLQFHLPEEWASLLLVAQFTQSETYNMLMTDDRCSLPVELKAGLCKVSLFGYSEGKPVRATSIPLVFQIEESGFVSSGETPIPPTPDLYAQLIDYFSSLVGSGGGGSGSGTINPEDIAAAVEDYLSKNPPEVPDLSDEVERAETAAQRAESANSSAQAALSGAAGAASDAEAAADRAEEAAKVTTDLDTTLTQEGKAADAKAVGDAISKLSGGNVENGEDGFSPIAKVEQTATGAVISITDKGGTTTATITNGKDGKDGADGAPGEKGDKGDKGDPGEPGQKGEQGEQGIQGIPGEKGEKGDTGAPGADGVKGDKGDKGDTGATGAQGEPGKDGANGTDGTSATHSWNGTVLTITSASGSSSADLKGAKGDKGDKGDTGAQGIQGIQGEPGAKGDKGEKGDTGATGSKGADGEHGESAHEIALRNGFVGDEKAWIASLHAANPVVLNKNQFATEAEAIAYMEAQGDNSAVYVWGNKLYCYTSMEVQSKGGGACLYGHRNSASSGIKEAEYGMLAIIPVSDFSAPVTIGITGYSLSQSPHIYGGTSPTAFPTTLIANDGWGGYTGPITIADLKSCTYVAFCLNKISPAADITITVNGESMVLKAITAISEIEGALSSGGSTTVNGFADSGVEYTAIIGQDNSNEYLDSRNTYVMPVPSGYCETHVPGKTITANWLGLYDFPTMTAMFTALATEHPDYVTETVLGKDASGTYDIKQYVLDAPSTLSSGYTSAMKHEKPVFILTSGLHGDEQDAVHMVYHFMKDLCENHMESDQLEYLRNNIKFVILPICNPWGYVNKAHYNANSVDLNKNFESGYQNNGTANTGTAAHSEAETKLMKGVFDTYSNAVFHLECHGKMQEANPFNTTIWFSLMQSLSSELIELCADTITKQIGRRLYKMGYDTNKSAGGYLTYYGLNGRPKDYTGTKYGILSATMEGCGRLHGETGYSANTQKINCEALENFVLRVMDTLDSGVKK